MKLTPTTSACSILVVDDEPLIRATLAEYLTGAGFAVTSCASGEEALAEAERRPYDVALCDVQLPGIDGIEVLERLLKISPETFVLLITAYATVESAVEAFQRGAHDYLMKPILLDEVAGKVRRLLAYRDLFLENQWLRRELSREQQDERIVGQSAVMKRVFELVRKVAPTRSTVLITGESGTGKELVARAIHRQGVGEGKRFLAVNCAAIPHDLLENQLFGHRKGAFTGADRDQPGVFVHAGDGTVFLDEVGELPPATNKDLHKEVEAGRFREDLYYRLDVFNIRLPALRERREDIPDLVEFLLAKHARAMGKRVSGVTHEAMQILRACRWKGNVRELDNALQRAVILGEGPLIAAADLRPDLAPVEGDPALVDKLSEAMERFEKQHLERILRQTADKREAAQRLDIGLSSLYRKIAELKISAP